MRPTPATRAAGRRVFGLVVAGVLVAGTAISQPAGAAPALAAPVTAPGLSGAANDVQSARAELSTAEQEVRDATNQAQQLSYAVVAGRLQLAAAQVAVTSARDAARLAIRLAIDTASVDPTATLFAALTGDDPDLASQVGDRRLKDAAARSYQLQQAVARLGSLNRETAGRRTAAIQAAARAVSAADTVRQVLAAAEQKQLDLRRSLELAAQRAELDQLNRELVRTLAALDASSPGSAGEPLTADSPVKLRSLYKRSAATCPGLPWGVVAAIGQVETDNGRNKAISSAGAMGPMQFLPSTFAIYGVDGDGNGKADILDQADAVFSAAHLLCSDGGGKSATLYRAIFAYNHSDYYVKTVLGLAAQYH